MYVELIVDDSDLCPDCSTPALDVTPEHDRIVRLHHDPTCRQASPNDQPRTGRIERWTAVGGVA
jgi:hypothetical protein